MVRRGLRSQPVLSAAVASVLAVAAGAAGSTYANASDATSSTPAGGTQQAGCTVLTGLSEFVLNLDYRDVVPAGPSVGDVGVYDDKLVDANGNVLAYMHGMGRILYSRESDGHVFVFYDDEYKFTDGSRVHAVGINDVNAIVSGGEATQALMGTAGHYRGYFGSRTWIRLSAHEAKVSITLCPDPA